MLNWKRDQGGALLRRLRLPALAAVAALVAAILIFGVRHAMAAIGFALGAWLLVGAEVAC